MINEVFKNLESDNVVKLIDVRRQIHQRCNNPNNRDFCYYGARGITICSDWSSDNPDGLINFLHWADEHGYQQGLSIDRIDNDGPYAPWNCRFADAVMQANNRSNNHRLTLCGITHTIAQWAIIVGIPAATLYTRIYRGWSVDRALDPTYYQWRRKAE